MTADDNSTEEWLRRAALGDRRALDELLAAHRSRLRRIVAVRLDRRLTGRIDASDVVQDSLLEATQRLPEYLSRQEVPFFVWLRQLAWQRVAQLYRHHVEAQCRSVEREAAEGVPLSEESAMVLADRLAMSGTSPSGRLRREELRTQVRSALARLAPNDQEVLVLRHLEQLSTREISAILQISEPAVRHRQRRALERLTKLLRSTSEEGSG
ncbi:MAG: sigma-70 family RNA polymerase sigma factor [Planctomycetes bacterium]|nr:sigma-70 family RNA polymerase sigma factor [Planctomycetota bacterium]MBL7044255.1 sigma-70 family RNA polymerase sigma factor [Pirellulaceae bacterium]